MPQCPQSSQCILRQWQPCPRCIRRLKREDTAGTAVLTFRAVEEVEHPADRGIAGERDAVVEGVRERRALGERGR